MKMMRWSLVLVAVCGLAWSGHGSDRDRDSTGQGELVSYGEDGGGPFYEGPGDGQPADVPGELVRKMEQARTGREVLLEELKVVLAECSDGTPEERREAAEGWRQENANRIQEQRDLTTAVRQEIREWLRASRPEQPAGPVDPVDPGEMTDPDHQVLMEQVRARHREQIRVREELVEQLQNATTAQERLQLMQQTRAQRMEQVRQRREDWTTRAVQLDRQESMAALRIQLRDSADELRARNRLRDREEDPIQERERITLRERQDPSERPERPERPETPERPDRPDRPDRFGGKDAPGSPADDARADQMIERRAP